MKLKIFATLASLFCLGASAQQSNEQIHLSSDNTVVFNTIVDEHSVPAIEEQLVALVEQRGDKDYPLYLVMDCPGGSIYAGENFIQFTKTIKNLHTVTIFAASMCSGIVEALPGKRYVTENGILMFHRAKGSFEGQFESGELESELAFWKSFVRKMESRAAKRIGISLAEYKERVKDEYWLVGDDNIHDGTADQVADIVCSQEMVDKQVTVEQETLFGPITVTRSACPLFR